MRTYILLLLLSISFQLNCRDFSNVESDKWTKKYDSHFRKYTKRFFGIGFDWKWFKAQAISESELTETAKSHVGARGIMQIMPATFMDIKKKNPGFSCIENPRWNIGAGIYYDNYLFKLWKAERPYVEKMKYTFASYNAGFGTILNAQKICEEEGLDTTYWENIVKIAPKTKRWRHKETIHYVKKICKLMKIEDSSQSKD